MNEQQEARLHEIMFIARELKWFTPNSSGYPLMQGSEVEKCILMAIDDSTLSKFRDAFIEATITTKGNRRRL